MKIGLIIEHVDPRRGGAETSTGQFINHLLARDVEVELFTRSPMPAQPRCTVRTIDAPGAFRAQATAAYLRNTTQGRASFTMQFDRYETVPAAVAEEVVARRRNGSVKVA